MTFSPSNYFSLSLYLSKTVTLPFTLSLSDTPRYVHTHTYTFCISLSNTDTLPFSVWLFLSFNQSSWWESGFSRSILLLWLRAYMSIIVSKLSSISWWLYISMRALNLSSPMLLLFEFLMYFSEEFALSTPLEVTDVRSNRCKILMMFGYISEQTLRSVIVSDKVFGWKYWLRHWNFQSSSSCWNDDGDGKSG